MNQDSSNVLKTVALMIPRDRALELNREGALLNEIRPFTRVKPLRTGDLRVEFDILETTDFDDIPMAVDAWLRHEGYIYDVTATFNNGPRYSDGRIYSDAYDDEITVTCLTPDGQEWLFGDGK